MLIMKMVFSFFVSLFLLKKIQKMNHSFSQLFYLKGKHFEKDVKVPIYLRLTVNGQRNELSISRKIEPEKWNARTGKMRGTSLETNELNSYLDIVRHKINKIHGRLVDEGRPFSSLDLKNLYLGKGEKLKCWYSSLTNITNKWKNWSGLNLPWVLGNAISQPEAILQNI